MHATRKLLLVASGVALLYMMLPVIVVISIAFGGSPNYEFPPTRLSLRWFAALLDTDLFTDALFKISLPLALVVAICSAILGTAAAVGAAQLSRRWVKPLELLFAAPIIFPQILLGVALFLLYSRLHVSLNVVSLAFAHVLIATPYVIRTVSAGINGIDPRIAQAAQNLGASPVRAFLLVTLPLLKSGIFSGAIFAFIVSFSDINLALFLTAAGNTTLPMQILAQMQFVSDPTIAAAATVQIVVVSLLLLLAQRVIGSVRV
jgi:putative spermidine/putrescine transport system permease protein